MKTFAIFMFFVQACLFGAVFSQCSGSYISTPVNYIVPGCSYGGVVSGAVDNGISASRAFRNGVLVGTAEAAYGGAGEGNIAVFGELPVAGSTAVIGQVPILGAVGFGGNVPAAGCVSINGRCSCGCEY